MEVFDSSQTRARKVEQMLESDQTAGGGFKEEENKKGRRMVRLYSVAEGKREDVRGQVVEA